jgi:hypothetical protein
MSFSEQTILDLIKVGDEQIVQSPSWYYDLITAINHLIAFDFNRLIQVLYRADVSENKIKKQLENNKDADAATIIANLLLERQLQKIKTKSAFPSKPPAANDESW